MTIQPYLFFEGRCEEAMAFYEKAMGARTVFKMRRNENPDMQGKPDPHGDKILHATMQLGNAIWLMSDGNCDGKASFAGFALSLNYQGEEDVRRVYGEIVKTGKEIMAPMKTFWSPCFSMVVDQFGVMWMLSVPGESA